MNSSELKPSGVQVIRKQNRKIVLRAIARQPGISRSDIAKQIGLTDAAVSRISRDLINTGFIREGEAVVADRPGRRHIGLEMDAGGAYALAACLTLSKQSLSIVDLAGSSLASRPVTGFIEGDLERGLVSLADNARDLMLSLEIPTERILGMGLVTAGAVDHPSQRVLASSLRAMNGVAIGPRIEAMLQVPVRVETVGNALNLAGGYRSSSQWETSGEIVYLVHVALGIGTSVMIGGRPFRTTQDERLLAHVPVVGANELCACGAIGCLATQASGDAVLRRLAFDRKMPPNSESAVQSEMAALEDAVSRANSGDPAWASLFQEAGEVLGRQLVPACCALPPHHIVLAGPVPQATAYTRGVADGLAQIYRRMDQDVPPVMTSAMGYSRAAELFALSEFLFAE